MQKRQWHFSAWYFLAEILLLVNIQGQLLLTRATLDSPSLVELRAALSSDVPKLAT